MNPSTVVDAPPSSPTLEDVVSMGRAGPYDLVLELAAGGMAMVLLGYATDGRATAPLVAIKRPHRHLATDKVFLSMLLDEARLASLIEHPNVVKVRELGFQAGEPFIVLDYVEGASLAELRKELSAAGRAIDARMALRVVLDALAGLHAAHELRDETGKLVGIIHRDVSPHNVLVGCDGRARLTDFGIAKAEDRVQTTRTHEVKGKLAYLAPERVDRRRMCTRQSDVFSMAVVLWECIAGRRLFRGDEAIDTLHEVMNAKIPRLRQIGARVGPALDDVIARGLSRDLSVRFATAADFAAALERAAGPGNIGQPEDVARTIEAIFGARLATRHERIRAALERPEPYAALLRASGLPQRAPPAAAAVVSDLSLLASMAPPAPSERYAFGKEPFVDEDVARTKKARWTVATGVVVGIGVGAAVTLVVAARPRAAPVSAHVDPASVLVAAPATRHVVVPLPFVATRVTLDDIDLALKPAADSVSFELPSASPARHRLIAVALDGTRAEGYVVEQGGVARDDSGGLAIVAPPGDDAGDSVGTTTASLPPVSSPRIPSSHPAAPRSTKNPVPRTRDGFTRLR